MHSRRIILALVVFLALFGAACSGAGTPDAIKDDQNQARESLNRLQDTQPTPAFDWSQVRQNLIELQTAQAQTTQTTTFFFNQGVADPIMSCPSIGFPIASTTQLTNPSQIVPLHNQEDPVIPQVEETGVYTGESSGTYVICLDAQGKPYADYWEGNVKTVSGPATWRNGRVELLGPSSFNFSANRAEAQAQNGG